MALLPRIRHKVLEQLVVSGGVRAGSQIQGLGDGDDYERGECFERRIENLSNDNESKRCQGRLPVD